MTRSTIYNFNPGSTSSANIGTASDIEQAAHTVNKINARIRRERREGKEIKRAALAKAKITLAPTPWDNEK